jgi:uncharacterized protein YoaH (UPF0181 family)
MERLARARYFHDGHRRELTQAYKKLIASGMSPGDAVLAWARALRRAREARGAAA